LRLLQAEGKGKNMKTAILALLLCFANSLAMADNPTDAPLLPENPEKTVAHPAKENVRARKHRGKRNACATDQTEGGLKAPEKLTPPAGSGDQVTGDLLPSL
jgi:hypothetical protein